MTELPWDIGDAPTVWAEFTDLAGAPANATVTVRVRKPDGTIMTPTPTNPSVGRYEAVLQLDQHGTWRYKFTATGALVAAEEGELLVRRDRVG